MDRNLLYMSLPCVSDTAGNESIDAVCIRPLLGDINSNGAVNAADVALAQIYDGQDADQTTFRADINTNGGVNYIDKAIVQANNLHTVSTCP